MLKAVYYHDTVEVEGARRPYHITVCEVYGSNQDIVLSRGMSICSFRDNYNRKLGNRIARGRAETALIEMCDSRPVRGDLASVSPFIYKCEYLPDYGTNGSWIGRRISSLLRL